MPYTPDAENVDQPTGNQALSTAALEFRTLKQYVQTTKTAQSAATALVASNLAAALVTQDSRDDAQDAAITAAAALGTTGIADAAAALLVAQGRLHKVVLTGSGNWTVPADVTSLAVALQGGSTAHGHLNSFSSGANFNYLSQEQAGQQKVVNLAVTPGDVIAYSCGTGQQVAMSGTNITFPVQATATTFGSVTARTGKTYYYFDSGSGTIRTETDTTLAFSTSTRCDGGMATIITGGNVTTSAMTDGAAGSITVFY